MERICGERVWRRGLMGSRFWDGMAIEGTGDMGRWMWMWMWTRV